MMEEFPELYELMGFFESEPEILDADIPHYYNCLNYRTVRADNTIYCAIEPACGQIILIWENSAGLVLSLQLDQVVSLHLVSAQGVEKMLAKFPEQSNLLDFELQLKPSVCVKWGNSLSR